MLKGMKVGTNIPGVVTDAVYHHVDSSKPDLHLYSSPDQAVAIDLENNKYGIIVFQVPQQAALEVAQRIHKEVGLKGEIRDDHV
ncbi:UNVERIFIED_CONTAM: hypothetical protein HDU68_009981 [Siphonaria sp. JEL0065]|nr:hypothetical protein HDU68_009981 [Siphonaria sp. JEL0065]